MELTYPLSSGYVQDWDAPRALAELIANALDEDANARLRYDPQRGVAVITDRGPGWPEEALILGYSTKDDSQVGQFGEGAKLAMLVLSRELGNETVEVRTAGMTLRPRLERRTLGIGRQAGDGLSLLIVETVPNRRRVGTEIVVRCTQTVYEAARGRFRHFTSRSYRGPGERGTVVPGPGGRVYIGGVLLRDDAALVCSYDFPLARAKRLMNRDRTVLDSWALSDLISDTLAHCDNAKLLEPLIGAALRGTLASVESTIPEPSAGTDTARAAWRRAGRRVLGRSRMFWTPDGQEELALSLVDRGWTAIPTTMGLTAFTALTGRLGIPTARQAVPARSAKARFVARDKLDRADRARMTRAVRAARRRFGPDAVGRLRVFTEAPDGQERWEGFYDPETGDIALHINVLADDQTLCATLAHEMAHRMAHRSGSDWTDRTRGFETALSQLAGAALSPRGRSRT